MSTTYAVTGDLQTLLNSTDGGSGTASVLTPAQLQQAIVFGSNRVSVYAGNVYDSSTPQAVPPDIFNDLTLDIAAFFATTTYMKSKVIGPTHPVWLRYQDAMKILNDVRNGVLHLDVVPPGGPGRDSGTVINRIPRVLTSDSSNTRFDPLTGTQEADLSGPSGANWTDFGSGYIYSG
jgi:phage gp36-like protein